MKATISPDRKTLTLTATNAERQELREADFNIHSDQAMHDFLGVLVGNSEFDWVSPDEVGDLTNAPMLGIYDYESKTERTVTERWAWMPYMVRSLLEQLRDEGEAILVGGAV